MEKIDFSRTPKSDYPILIIAGPTGVGKTQLAYELACSGGQEIVSADSMQVYRGMEIGTAQPSEELRRRIRFHVCGMIDPAAAFNVSQFLDLCDQAHRSILDRGKTPLYTGGTGLYLRALRWGIFGDKSRDKNVRRDLEMKCEAKGLDMMYAGLQKLDPVTAQRVSPHDRMRIIRALEVYGLTGKPISELQSQWSAAKARFPHRLVVVATSRKALRNRIRNRTGEMLKHGWIEEVEALSAVCSSTEGHCFKALGFREIIQYLGGKLKREELEEIIIRKTYSFARRQMVWLRRECPATWIHIEGNQSMRTAVALIEKHLASN